MVFDEYDERVWEAIQEACKEQAELIIEQLRDTIAFDPLPKCPSDLDTDEWNENLAMWLGEDYAAKLSYKSCRAFIARARRKHKGNTQLGITITFDQPHAPREIWFLNQQNGKLINVSTEEVRTT